MATIHLNDFAIVVGVNIYQHPDFENLNGAVNDAAAFSQWLTEEQGVPEKHIFKFISDPLGTEPTLDQVYRCITKLIEQSSGGEEQIGRRLYLFFSGHGVGKDIDETGLLAADHSPSRDSYLVGKMLADIFSKSAVFEQVVLFMDCCRDYDGELTPPYNPFRIKVDPDAHEVSRCYCYGAKFNRKSHEQQLEGVFHGIFTWFLLQGLKVPDEHGRVTAKRLKSFVTHKLTKLDQRQIPDFPDSDLILADGLPPVYTPVIIKLAGDQPAFKIYDSSFKLIKTKPKPLKDNKWQVDLIPGKLYSVSPTTPPCDDHFPIKVEDDGIYNINDERIDYVEL